MQVIVDRLTDPTSLGAGFAKYAEFRSDREWRREDYEPWPGANSSAMFPDGAERSRSGLGWDDYTYEVIEANGPDLRGRYGPMYVALGTPCYRHFWGFEPLPPPMGNLELQYRSITLLGAFGFTENQARDVVLQIFAEYILSGDTLQRVGRFEVGLASEPLISEDAVSFTIGPAAGDNPPSTGVTQDLPLLARWEGQATKDTETFHVSTEEWRISWDTQPGQYGSMNFQIYVYKADGTPHGTFVAANVIGADQDSTIMRGSGAYYLTINMGQPYTVTVEALE